MIIFICSITRLYMLVRFILVKCVHVPRNTFLNLIYHIFRILAKLVDRINFLRFRLSHWSVDHLAFRSTETRYNCCSTVFHYHFHFNSFIFSQKPLKYLHVGRPKVFSKLPKVKSLPSCFSRGIPYLFPIAIFSVSQALGSLFDPFSKLLQMRLNLLLKDPKLLNT